MVIERLIKSKSFIIGFAIGLLLTFGRAYISFLEKFLSPIFEFWIKIWPTGLFIEVIPLYISGLVIFIFIWFIFLMRQSHPFINSLMSFSFGFLLSFVIFLLLALVAISQFKFTQ